MVLIGPGSQAWQVWASHPCTERKALSFSFNFHPAPARHANESEKEPGWVTVCWQMKDSSPVGKIRSRAYSTQAAMSSVCTSVDQWVVINRRAQGTPSPSLRPHRSISPWNQIQGHSFYARGCPGGKEMRISLNIYLLSAQYGQPLFGLLSRVLRWVSIHSRT